MKNQKQDASQEIICQVDAYDSIVNPISRGEMRNVGLLHRVTYLLVFSSQGQLLVQTRTHEKDWYPGRLDFAAGGVVLFGESYEVSAQRELYEEIGISTTLTSHFDVYFEDRSSNPITNSWGRVFSCVSDGPFVLQREEVAAVEFLDIQPSLDIDSTRVTPDTRQVLIAYLLQNHATGVRIVDEM